MISQLMQFLGQQPQLMVCGQLGLKPLTDDKRRDLLDSVKLYDALETVACVQGQWDVAYTTTHRVDLGARSRRASRLKLLGTISDI
ncbi:hypothetical protein [Mycobacterium riyadhense]|uniref:hypothetical protein n=1 Tax=Mycobacterium riyadhense TaxID=486698 RepID=UPI00195CE934|nr:hypothetical protein [Mycobacterium riyadhense]